MGSLDNVASLATVARSRELTSTDSDRWAHSLFGTLCFSCICGGTVRESRDAADSNDADSQAMRMAATTWYHVVCPACGRFYAVGLVVTQYESPNRDDSLPFTDWPEAGTDA